VGDFDSLRRRYGTIYGTRISTPRLWRTDRLSPAVLAARTADEFHPDRRRPDERPPEERRRA
jgi:hypothetical protein